MKLLTSEWVKPPFDESVEFYLRGMNGLEYLEYSSHTWGGKKITFTEAQAKVALRAVTDWKGVTGESGPVKFSQDALSMCDLQTISWLLQEIVSRSVMDADTEKN